jgi:hypothetical protein
LEEEIGKRRTSEVVEGGDGDANEDQLRMKKATNEGAKMAVVNG